MKDELLERALKKMEPFYIGDDSILVGMNLVHDEVNVLLADGYKPCNKIVFGRMEEAFEAGRIEKCNVWFKNKEDI